MKAQAENENVSVRDIISIGLEAHSMSKTTSRYLYDQIELQNLTSLSISECASALEGQARLLITLVNLLDKFDDTPQARKGRPS